MKWQINVKTDKKTLKKKEKEKKCHLWAKLLSMHLLEAATWIYKPQKKKLFCLRILLLEPKSGSCCKMHQKKKQQKKDFSSNNDDEWLSAKSLPDAGATVETYHFNRICAWEASQAFSRS